MACQVLANFFAWGLKHEQQQPTIKLTLTTYKLEAGLKGNPPRQVPVGNASGDLFYSPVQVVKVGRVNLQVPASFGGEMRYTPDGAGLTQNINVQILAFGDNFDVTFHPTTAPIHGGFVPSCSAVPIGTLAGTITGFNGELGVTMHLIEA